MLHFKNILVECTVGGLVSSANGLILLSCNPFLDHDAKPSDKFTQAFFSTVILQVYFNNLIRDLEL